MLGQEKKDNYSGDFVLNNQKTSEGFRNVSSLWMDKCIDYDTAMEKIADDQRKIQDIRGGLQDFTPAVSESGEAVLRYKDGREFVPTDHALKNIAVAGRTSDWFLRDLREDKTHQTKDEVVFKRDSGDAELLVQCLEQTLWRSDRFDQGKERLWRTWSDGSLRAMLSDKYAIVNNEWVMEVIRGAIPAGMLSHWRGDADNMYGNVLIPDTIREEDDSDYGGMVSIGNCEIAKRNVMSMPSLFRAICMNGCIWSQMKGNEIKVRHIGDIDFDQLSGKLRHNIEAQIPLIPQGIERMLGLRAKGTDGVPMKNIIAAVAEKSVEVDKRGATAILEAWVTKESKIAPVERSLFDVVNSVTRAGQYLDNQSWVKFDELGGRLTNSTDKQWENLKRRAGDLEDADLSRIFSGKPVLTLTS